MANFAGKLGLKVGRTRIRLGSGGSFGSNDSDPIGLSTTC